MQAEAPPSALFSKFKSVINAGGAKRSDGNPSRASNAITTRMHVLPFQACRPLASRPLFHPPPSLSFTLASLYLSLSLSLLALSLSRSLFCTVAFYFTHWITDVAGAVPTPLDGSEKFVLQFPSAVLGSFVRSFSVIHELAHKPETAVLEDYLHQVWRDGTWTKSGGGEATGDPTLSDAARGESHLEEDLQLHGTAPPTGLGSIALMRLLTQAQDPESQAAVYSAFAQLNSEDRRTLGEEMAMTGINGQSFRSQTDRLPNCGPAILMYYSPAFLRNLASDGKHLAALQMIAEIYRRTRSLWPLRPLEGTDTSRNTVTVRIDQIKGLSLEAILDVYMHGNSWLVYKRNEQEAVVECHTINFMADLLQQGTACAVLKFYRKRKRKRKVGEGSRSGASSPSMDDSMSDCSFASRSTNKNSVELKDLISGSRPLPHPDEQPPKQMAAGLWVV